ncbi:uncharacterized protein BCR38DRAFT_409092 [Pseudomassariella vexata]|uniref:CCZ1/INTU/HSP4 first Longin domain-containing protein n=1 Tax=Pseudomassariella vexata TaxID=1141098 RepID=A0A1Y2E1H1_9PEZI|nr:uncharacterized protein BCR38DRAFT_409092 [Pseudomassariella vexata]ORY65391.1 hypothetical protein BCR38DRAFT_409092 [Pseudomassariella vexata]
MVTPASSLPGSVVPAQLGFLAIFNPTLGTTDETIDDQIVYYASVNTQASRRRNRSRANPTENLSKDERNERLRQIGLAQGMVDFSRGFARGQSVNTIETEKSRVVLHELEPGWWILASIDLTKLPLPPRLGASASKMKEEESDNVEYSSREVKPAALLLQDLLRAHSIFLLHHAASLSALFVRSKRSKFVIILSRYWDLFLSTWNVMLHGNPACAVLGGIKLGACGELGVGVGEEERGSGEREVLEGFVGRVEGLVDLVVSKFGDLDPEKTSDSARDRNSDDSQSSQWLGTGEEPGAEDGAVFLGVGALSRKSLRDITYWMEDLYTWGENAYGVKENATSTRVKARRVRVQSGAEALSKLSAPQTIETVGSTPSDQVKDRSPSASISNGVEANDDGRMDKFMSYLRMGYGTHWSLGNSGTESTQENAPETAQGAQTRNQNEGEIEPVPKKEHATPTHPFTQRSSTLVDRYLGHYLIGLQGDVDHADSETPESRDSDSSESNQRTLLRTLTVELENEGHDRPEANIARDFGSHDNELEMSKSGRKGSADPKSHFDSQDRNKTKKMRVVVYASKPFIYAFLFENRTESLAWGPLYKSLHYQLAPLRKTLASSTKYRPDKPDVGAVASHIFDLVWDPRALTVHSTIPSIPEPPSLVRIQDGRQQQQQSTWSRAEALNTHTQILNTYVATRGNFTDVERTCKTSRGWWVVWTRIMVGQESSSTTGTTTPPPLYSEDSKESTSTQTTDSSTDETTLSMNASDKTTKAGSRHGDAAGGRGRGWRRRHEVSKEIFLIRRAGEHGAGGIRGISNSYAEGGSGWADGATRLVQGIGVDTKSYVEGLLTLGR